MSKKLYVILIHAIYIAIAICSIRYIKQINYEKIDIATLNKSYKEIEELYQNNQFDIAKIEDDYDCHIALVQDKDYKKVMYEAIKNGYAIFDLFENDSIIGKIIFNHISIKYADFKKNIAKSINICFLLFICIFDCNLIYFYLHYERPFTKLRSFASEVAKGNLDAPLGMDKHNYFGAFTESFDVMREELKTSKQREYEANQSKKELVASLSHDMKTPIATIEASCELLLLQLKENEHIDKIELIANRAHMINHLINNMFHATLEELETLEVTVTEEPSTLINGIVESISLQGDIHICNACPECLICVDRLRITQVIDNIINNSQKYANTKIDISFDEVDNGIIIIIRDYGPGVPSKSLPLLIEKFYRAENANGKTGAGLGMYLANYFMERMGGEMEYYNDQGFVVELFLQKC